MTLYEKIKLKKIEKKATLFSVAWNRAAIDNNMVQATKLLGDQAGRTLDTITREELNGGDIEGGITMKNLLEITGQESGLILHWNGELMICNWQSINGLPRLDPMGFGLLGLGEELYTDEEPAQIDDIGAWLNDIDYDLIYDRNDDLSTLDGQSGKLFRIGDVRVIAPDGWN